ncbi:hypothetical protein PR202_gb07204 [Eleusine coracana subsp. coracana]|uniref:Electron transfer flavoprotein-ubiquinone oxidoreductase n=1 Tax=Eleusine coracana subsp. coracana TaxID=191504 RepID=A0AAV5E934_ELECO|nr:hypothetical protein PR202_gb07204 [Eleusine coracana subsp. coracana]
MHRALRAAVAAASAGRALSSAWVAAPRPGHYPRAVPCWGAAAPWARWLCSGREALSYDVVIVGAGPAGLAAAIRLKQLCRAADTDLSVCVLEKGSEVGAHVLSGNVFEPRALDELIPKWRQEDAPIRVPVTSDKFWFLTKNQAWTLPSPFDNKGNYVISLSQLVRWMATKAEELGVEVYPGFAASEILYDENQIVTGVATNDVGIAKDGRITLLAEGCRGSLSEVWEIEEGKHDPGSIVHTVGWPLDSKTYGGSFLYHLDDRQLAIGLVVALNYRNPFLSPYDEFQSIPYPVFPGGAIIGCSAGFLNVPKIKGTHTAMKSGMLSAEATFKALVEGSSMELYWENLKKSWIWEELYKARNYRPAFEHGLIPGMALSALER